MSGSATNARSETAAEEVPRRESQGRPVIPEGPEPALDQERELEALLELSQRGRSKLERLHEILTMPGHYGTGATPDATVSVCNPPCDADTVCRYDVCVPPPTR